MRASTAFAFDSFTSFKPTPNMDSDKESSKPIGARPFPRPEFSNVRFKIEEESPANKMLRSVKRIFSRISDT